MTNRLAMRGKPSVLRAYISFFVVASLFAERTMAVVQEIAPRQGGLFQFESPSAGAQTTTCTPFNITWNYNGPPTSFTLLVSSAPSPTINHHYTDATDNGVPTGASNPMPLLTVVIASNVQSATSLFTWSSVNVSQGWYVVSATIAGSQFISNSFYVLNGKDTTCLSASTSMTSMPLSTTSTHSVSSTVIQPSSTGSTPVAVGGSSTTSTHSVGAIVGITIGAVALLVLALGAWFWLYKKRRVGGPSPNPNSRRWNGLDSVDSRGGLMGTTGRHPRASSIGTLPLSPSDDVVASEKNSVKNGDPSPFADGARGSMALTALPILHHDARDKQRQGDLARSHSNASTVSNGRGAGRRPSVADSLDSMGYPPSSPGVAMYAPTPSLSRTHSISTSTNHLVGPPSVSSHAGLMTPDSVPASPLDTSPASTGDVASAYPKRNRRSLGATKRKPVPLYSPGIEDDAHLGLPSTNSSSAPSPVPPPSPLPDHTPHYIARSQAGHDKSQHELVHKSSFGPGGIEGKQLHYLMPDPPMAPRD